MSEFPLPESEINISPSFEIVNGALLSLEGAPYHQRELSVSLSSVEVNFVPYLVKEVHATQDPDASKEALHVLSNYLHKRAEQGLLAVNAPTYLSVDNIPGLIREDVHRAYGLLPNSPTSFAELMLKTINLQTSKSTEWHTSQNINQWSMIAQQLLVDLYTD